jgi:hypothetical protein
MNYVLVVTHNDTLDICELFDMQQDALDTAITYCNINNLLEDIRFDPSVEGWLVFQNDTYFVAVVRRTARDQQLGYHEVTKKSFSSLKSVLTANTAQNPGCISSVVFDPNDDPYSNILPFGFDFNGKPVRMEDAQMTPSLVVPVHQLTEDQKWAVVMARVKSRPHICFYDMATNKRYPQQELLKEIRLRSSAAINFLNYELSILDYFYSDHYKSDSSEEEYEESSSSDEEGADNI